VHRPLRLAVAVAAAGALGVSPLIAAAGATPGRTLEAHAHSHAPRDCRVPSLTGLTLVRARARAARAGCAVRTRAVQAPGAQPWQRIVQQSPTAGTSARRISVWLAPRCPKPGPTAPLAHEPFATAGPTELISGFYVVGGPATPPWVCPRVPEPLADTITIIDTATGATVATETVGQGELASIPVAPGTYTVRATPPGNLRPTIAQRTVTIAAATTVRQDFFADVP
jgi:hypothetical protein